MSKVKVTMGMRGDDGEYLWGGPDGQVYELGNGERAVMGLTTENGTVQVTLEAVADDTPTGEVNHGDETLLQVK